jgi:hypothetical protein
LGRGTSCCKCETEAHKKDSLGLLKENPYRRVHSALESCTCTNKQLKEKKRKEKKRKERLNKNPSKIRIENEKVKRKTL